MDVRYKKQCADCNTQELESLDTFWNPHGYIVLSKSQSAHYEKMVYYIFIPPST